VKKKNVYAAGSIKMRSIRKWSWYIRFFMTIASGENFSLAMTPTELLAEYRDNPALIAILQTIQVSVRKWAQEGIKEVNVNGRQRQPGTKFNPPRSK
jgi:hypothetical protein